MGKPRTPAAEATVTLDAGALIALERGNPRMIALLQLVATRSGRFDVPAGVVAQVWRDGARQAVVARFLRTLHVEIRPLDGDLARACGELCAVTRTADVVDASVVLTARQHRNAIITSDVDDLRRLDPSAVIERI